MHGNKINKMLRILKIVLEMFLFGLKMYMNAINRKCLKSEIKFVWKCVDNYSCKNSFSIRYESLHIIKKYGLNEN